jgi:hypothetical protein
VIPSLKREHMEEMEVNHAVMFQGLFSGKAKRENERERNSHNNDP